MTPKGKKFIIITLSSLILAVFAFHVQAGKADTLAPQNGSESEVFPISNRNQIGALAPADISRMAHATVRITGMRRGAKREYPIFSGSGTILTPDGIILTNCHVANPRAMGYAKDMWIDSLVVSILVDEDAPPVPTYHAERLAYDSKLDLAVIRITETLDGKAVIPGKLNLPYVNLGNSDSIGLGENLNIFGYPSIGGETITFTTGVVSGFDSEEPMGNRAWIKTAAMIAGGNSGGLAANDKGEIIGVPTRGGTSSAESITDCRRIEDINGDGTIDDEDTCIPSGGFINGIRPIKWALPMIDAVKKGLTYASPYLKQKATEDQPQKSEKKKFSPLGWSADEPKDCDFDAQKGFDSGIDRIYAVFKPNDAMHDSDEIRSIWYIDDERALSDRIIYDPGDCIWFALTAKKGETLPDGAYRLELYYEKILLADTQTRIGMESAKIPSGEGVMLQGTIKDAETGKPVPGISVIVLKPGVDASDWINDTAQKDIFSQTLSNRSGKYRLPDKLERGQTYPIIFGSAEDNYRVRFGIVEIPADAGDTVRMDIEVTEIH